MNTLSRLEISQWGLLGLLIVSILLYLALRLLRRAVYSLKMRRSLRQTLLRFLPLVESLVWLYFLLWSLRHIFKTPQFYLPLAVFVLLLGLGAVFWYAGRDFIAGMIFKLAESLKPGEQIQLENLEGKVVSIGHLSLQIETGEGELASVPYSRLAGQVRRQQKAAEVQESGQFRLSLPANISPAQAGEKIRLAVMNSPWASPLKEPRIQVVADNGDQRDYQVVVFTAGEGYIGKIETYVRERIGNNSGK
ncbi:MAG: mechanosensitive ion channel domain-containing protein [Calditrichia bacterium]